MDTAVIPTDTLDDEVETGVEYNAYANPDMDTAVIPTDTLDDEWMSDVSVMDNIDEDMNEDVILDKDMEDPTKVAMEDMDEVFENDEYLSDEDIDSQYNDFVVTNISQQSNSSGYITIEFPNAEHPDFDSEKTTGYIIYDDGTVAFDDWFPEHVYNELVQYVKSNSEGQLSEAVEVQPDMFDSEYDDVYKDGRLTLDFNNVLDAMDKIAPDFSFIGDNQMGDEYCMIYDKNGSEITNKDVKTIQKELTTKFGHAITVKTARSEYAPEQKKIYICFIDKADFSDGLDESIDDDERNDLMTNFGFDKSFFDSADRIYGNDEDSKKSFVYGGLKGRYKDLKYENEILRQQIEELKKQLENRDNDMLDETVENEYQIGDRVVVTNAEDSRFNGKEGTITDIETMTMFDTPDNQMYTIEFDDGRQYDALSTEFSKETGNKNDDVFEGMNVNGKTPSALYREEIEYNPSESDTTVFHVGDRVKVSEEADEHNGKNGEIVSEYELDIDDIDDNKVFVVKFEDGATKEYGSESLTKEDETDDVVTEDVLMDKNDANLNNGQYVNDKTLFHNKNKANKSKYQSVSTSDFGKKSSEGTKRPADCITMESTFDVRKIKKIYETAKNMYSKKDKSDWLKLDRRYITKLMENGMSFSNASILIERIKK